MNAVCRAPAEFNVYAVSGFAAEIKALLAGLPADTPARVDLAGVTELDGAGLQFLVACAGNAARDGHPVTLVAAPDCVRARFEQFGLAHLLAAPLADGASA